MVVCGIITAGGKQELLVSLSSTTAYKNGSFDGRGVTCDFYFVSLAASVLSRL